jgi:PAS domain S-box-containing protein
MKPSISSPVWAWATLSVAMLFIGWASWLVIVAQHLHGEVQSSFVWGSRLAQLDESLTKCEDAISPRETGSQAAELAQPPEPRIRESVEGVLLAGNRLLTLPQRPDPRLWTVVTRLVEEMRAIEQGALERRAEAQEQSNLAALRSSLKRAREATREGIALVQARQEELVGQLASRWRSLTVLVLVACVLAIFIALLWNLHMQEIGRRRRTENERRLAEAKYRSIFENAVEGIFQTTPEGRFLAANPALARMWGYASPEDFLTRIVDLERQLYVDPSRRRDFMERIERDGFVEGFEYQSYRADGSIIWVSEHARAVRDAEGRVLYYEGTIQDITRRKQAEEALRASEAKYRMLVENLDQGIYLKDRELRFVAANAHLCRMLGQPEQKLIGSREREISPGPLAEQHEASEEAVLEAGQPVETEETLDREGQTLYLRIRRSPVRDDQGRPVGVLGIVWDVTEQKQLQAQLLESQKMEAIGRLAGGIAHDFNNLLTVVLGGLDAALAALPEGHPLRDNVAIGEQAAVRAAELTKQLLSLSRRAIGRLQPILINSAVQETISIFRRSIDPRIAIEVKLDERLWPVMADRSQLCQVVMNLCLNARDAMPQGGKLTLETANVVLDDKQARRHPSGQPGQYVRLTVRDTGCGMPADVRARIFEPFFTTKGSGRGTGLGLATVFGIIKQHRGWIECTSEVGQGTTFTVYLPRHERTVEVAEQPVSTVGPLQGQETILVVDDEESIRALSKTALTRYGYQVLLAEDGLQAIDTYVHHKDRIALIVLDLTMPHLSGRETLAQLLQVDPDVPVLISSGYSAETLSEEEVRHVLGFLGKPYRAEELAVAVRQALTRARERGTTTPEQKEASLASATADS